ncbi:MAG: hypothetical protein EBQ67_00375 [Sphingobacteriia bacterium]|nr:hypothetical protein [Sphingobacteriia bacterium]NDC72021.1 hypothetical protein [Sphingobacteriia bacterium]
MFNEIAAFRLAILVNSLTTIGMLTWVELLQMLSDPMFKTTGGAAEVTLKTAILDVTGLAHVPLTLTLNL